LWVKFAKKGSGIASISFPEALQVAMRFGWVDSKMHRYDNDYYVLRYQPRRPKSIWSARHKDLAERLIADGRRPQDSPTWRQPRRTGAGTPLEPRAKTTDMSVRTCRRSSVVAGALS